MPQAAYSDVMDCGYNDKAGSDDAIYRDASVVADVLKRFYYAGSSEDLDDFAYPRYALATVGNMAILHSDDYIVYPASAGIVANITIDNSNEAPLQVRAANENLEEYKHPLFQELYRMYHEYSEHDWDGCDAVPVSENTFTQAYKFARFLPDSVPLPEVMPEPTGEIAFEWYQDATHVFVVSVGEEGTLSYAGLFGKHCQAHGTERLAEHIPQSLLNHIARLSL